MLMLHRNRRLGSSKLRAAGIAALLGIAITNAGCAPAGKSGSMNEAVGDYQSQRYDDAHDEAAEVMAKSTGTQRERAAYVAGLSAYQSGNSDAAERELIVATVSSDPQIAGNSKVMMGQLRLDQHRPREAAGYFADASRLLEGEDARQAAWHAGLAYREAGDETNAKRWLDNASGSGFDAAPSATPARVTSTGGARTSSALASPAAATPKTVTSVKSNADLSSSTNGSSSGNSAAAGIGQTTVGYTLQIGAFSDKKRARSAAEDAEALAKREGMGRVRIIPRRDARGQPMYLVHVGWWVTRSEAATARTKVGRLEYIVAPAPAE